MLTASLASALFLPGCGGGAGGPRTATDGASVATSPERAAASSNPGDFAADYLRGTKFSSLRIEVDYPAGSPPSPEAIDLLRDRLEERCDKPRGVAWFLDEAIPRAEFPDVLSARDLAELEDAHRNTFSDLGTGVAALYVLCVPGASALDTSAGEIVGLAYRGGSLALFLDNADQGDDPWVTTAEVEATALVHEAGHLMGLVNSGVPMVVDHEDRDHPGHDTDSTSVMFWAIAVPRITPTLGDPDFAQFGPACIADLKAFGGR